jgi:hypothetical protein
MRRRAQQAEARVAEQNETIAHLLAKGDERVSELRARVAELERGYHYFSMCQDEHEQIGWHPGEWEECPVCRERNKGEELERMLRLAAEWAVQDPRLRDEWLADLRARA